ncbi:MAG: DUF371 domain-containing protein, partial [Candidatus Hodarchaeota archaeon]
IKVVCMKIIETVIAHGHENIQATHKTTFEITKETQLSRKGNCIIAVSANKSALDLNSEFRKNLHKKNARITILIRAGDAFDIVKAWGTHQLFLTHPTAIVVRKSSYTCNKTLAIRANKAANDLSRKLVERLTNSQRKVHITFILEI